MDNKISFKSNIRFVDSKKFVELLDNAKKYTNCKKIDHLRENNVYIRKSLRHKSSFYTREIKTCTGGGLVIPKKEANGFHFLHSKNIYDEVDYAFNDIFFQDFTPERALLIGGKELPECPYSLKNFKKISDLILAKVKNVSMFFCHRYKFSDSNFLYTLKDDTWTICTTYFSRNKTKEIKKLKDLKAVFKHIKIAKGDNLYIGDRKILPNECPQMFA